MRCCRTCARGKKNGGLIRSVRAQSLPRARAGADPVPDTDNTFPTTVNSPTFMTRHNSFENIGLLPNFDLFDKSHFYLSTQSGRHILGWFSVNMLDFDVEVVLSEATVAEKVGLLSGMAY